MLTLHESYSRDEILVTVDRAETPESYCDGQFVVLSDRILCLFAIDPSETGTHLPAPSRLTWRPERHDYSPGDRFSWMPSIVWENFDYQEEEPRKIRDHHVFLRMPNEEKFLYAGQAELGVIGTFPDRRTGASIREASFVLDDKLPRELWIRFGGSPGWIVEINHAIRRVAGGDVATFRELAAAMLIEKYSHLSMTRYEEDSLQIFTNAKRGWLMYLRTPSDRGLYLRGGGLHGLLSRKQRFQCTCGIDLTYPAAQTVPRDQALQLAEEFFQTGTLPQSVTWTSEF